MHTHAQSLFDSTHLQPLLRTAAPEFFKQAIQIENYEVHRIQTTQARSGLDLRNEYIEILGILLHPTCLGGDTELYVYWWY